MPAWPGGPCPNCGDDVPALVVRCRECGHLLNDDLEAPTETPVPDFVPLKELAAEARLEPRGVYDDCPACGRELRINLRYAGQVVRCKHCAADFTMPASPEPTANRKAYYADCPHCRRELKLAAKYYGELVACKFCRGSIRFGADENAQSDR